MSDSSIPTPVGITLDMHARGVRALTEPSGDVYSVRALDPEVAEQVVTQVLGAALAGRTVDEYAVQMSGGGMHVRVSDPQVERIYPLADWLKHSSRNGTRVWRRCAVVVEDWHEVAAESSEPCCDLHGEHCEPPADLCCTDCSAGVLPWAGQVTT
jgi:hypothetical protein